MNAGQTELEEKTIENQSEKIKSIYDNDVLNTEKLSGEGWSNIEKPLSDREKKVNEMILNYGDASVKLNGEEDMTNKNIKLMGEIYYVQLRKELNDCGLLKLEENKKEKNTEDKKREDKIKKELQKELSKSKNKVILDNTTEKLRETINILKDLLVSDKMVAEHFKNNIIKFNFLEFRVILLMKMIENETNKVSKKVEIDENIDELIIGSKKILFLLRNKKGKNEYKKICKIENVEIDICEMLIDDLNLKINNLLEKKSANLCEIANRNPKIIYETIYDDTLPNQKIKMHESQKMIIKMIKNNFENGFLVLYKTLPGLGKTSMVLSVCSFVRKLNAVENKSSKEKKVVIFCCSDVLKSVRLQVLRIAFNFGIKFGIATTNKSGTEYKITNSWNCSNDEERELIAGDYNSTALILKENKKDYLLFFDEPTFLTDNENNKLSLKHLSDVLCHLPKRTILSSATLPEKEEISLLLDDFIGKYEGAKVCEVISNKTLTGCFIKDFESNIIVPHQCCKNIEELEKFIIKFKKCPTIGKFYTLPFLLNFNEFCKKLDIGLKINEIENFEQDNILENILQLFDNFINLLKKSDEKNMNIKEIYQDFIKIEIKEIEDKNVNNKKKDENYDKIEYKNMLSKHAYKYIGGCLIVDDDPLEFARENFFQFVEIIKKKLGLDSINKYYLSYLKKKKEYEDKLEEIEKKYKSDDVINERKKILKPPKINFNKGLEINTTNHILNFSKYVEKCDETILKKEIDYESLDITKYKIDDNAKFLLFIGVGIYSRNLDSDYTEKVLELLSDGKLAYIIADESFTHGSNYPIRNIIISDKFGDMHGINTILQTIGRASRYGLAWCGTVYLEKNTKKKVINFLTDDKINNEESENIINSYIKRKREIMTLLKNKNKIKNTSSENSINSSSKLISVSKINVDKVNLNKKNDSEVFNTCDIPSNFDKSTCKDFNKLSESKSTNELGMSEILKNTRESLIKANSLQKINFNEDDYNRNSYGYNNYNGYNKNERYQSREKLNKFDRYEGADKFEGNNFNNRSRDEFNRDGGLNNFEKNNFNDRSIDKFDRDSKEGIDEREDKNKMWESLRNRNSSKNSIISTESINSLGSQEAENEKWKNMKKTKSVSHQDFNFIEEMKAPIIKDKKLTNEIDNKIKDEIKDNVKDNINGKKRYKMEKKSSNPFI